MAHHLSGLSNSAKRRHAEAAAQNDHDGAAGKHSTFELLQSRFGNLCSMGKEKVIEAEHAVEESIQHRPIIAVVAAAGIGALAGALCTMACSRSKH